MLLRRDASEAATQNFEIVTDAYRRGAVTIIRLVDAQTQALQTQLAAANATYDFMADFVSVERAAGRFSIMTPDDERDDFVRRLLDFERMARGQGA